MGDSHLKLPKIHVNFFSYETAEWLLVRITNIPCQSAKTAAEAWLTKSDQE